MTLDDLRAKWRDEMTQQSMVSDSDLRAITKEVAEISRAVRVRDFWFIAALLAAAGLSTFFVLMNSEYFEWPTIVGACWFLVITATAVTVLVWARSGSRSRDWTLRARFEHEIGSLRKQKWLLDNVHYWFLGPLAVAVLIGVVTHDPAKSIPWAYYVFSAVALVVTYWLCHRESARRFGPLLRQLQALHRDLTAS